MLGAGAAGPIWNGAIIGCVEAGSCSGPTGMPTRWPRSTPTWPVASGAAPQGQLNRQIRALHASEDRQKRYATVRLWDRSTEAVDNSVENHGRQGPKCRGLLTLLVF